MARALASHQCGQVSISAIRWVESVVGSHLAPRVFLFLPTRPEMSIRIKKKTAKVDVPSSLNIVIYFFYDYFFFISLHISKPKARFLFFKIHT